MATKSAKSQTTSSVNCMATNGIDNISPVTSAIYKMTRLFILTATKRQVNK